MPLLAVSFLIGSWLLFPKAQEDNEIFDPGAEELPRSNQALRGATLNTLFGTNRVSSNITWTKNWNVERHETSSSGGNKGGGSGGSKQPEQPGQVSYTYTWDIMCTLGMVPETYSLYGGWTNQQRMNDDVIASIGQDFTNFSFQSPSSVPNEAQIEFVDAFYHGGSPTTDTTADNWDYWEAQEGFPCRWPSIAWIGFETLNLGNRAALPTLEWEIGPGDAQLNFLGGFIDQANGGDTGVPAPTAHEFIFGDDGERYIVGDDGTPGIYRFDKSAGTLTLVEEITASETETAGIAMGMPSDGYTYTTRSAGGMIQGTDKYFWTWGQGAAPNLHGAHMIVLWKINSSGIAEAVGGYMAVAGPSFGAHFINASGSCSISKEQSSSDPILLFYTDTISGTVRPRLMAWPSINEMLTSANGGTGPRINADDTEDEWDAVNLTLTSEVGLNFGSHDTYRTGVRTAKWGWFMPTAVVGLGLTWQTQFKWYVSKADVAWHEDNPGAGFPQLPSQHIYDNEVAYPNGWIGSLDITVGDFPSAPTMGSWSIDNANWVDFDDPDTAVVPFSDEGLDPDGTADDRSGYSWFPTVQKVDTGSAAGMWAAVWGKMNSPKAATSTTGEFIGARVFLWNPVDKVAAEISQVRVSGSTLDTVSDLGVTEPNRYLINEWYVAPIWDQETELLYKYGIQNGVAPAGQNHISLYGGLTISGVGDVLPPYIIYQVLTNPVFGMGVATADVDDTSYQAALTYCRAEDTWVSVQYTRESSKLNVIEELLSLYGGYLTVSAGKVKFGLQDLSSNSVRVIDNDHLVRKGDNPPVLVTLSAKDDSYNKVLINYLDRSLEYRQNQAELNDEVDQDLHGVRKKEFPPKFVMSKATATNLGIRALWSNLYGKDTYNFTLSMRDADLEAGDVITLVDSFHPMLSSGQRARITRINERKRNEIDIIAVTEIEYINTSSVGAIDVTSASARDPIYGPSRVPANQWAYELPREFQGSQPKVYIGYNALSTNRGAWLYSSDDGVSYAQVSAAEPFVISGILAGALPSRPDGYMEQNIDIFLFPDTRSGFTSSSPVYVNTFALETTGASGRQAGLNTMIVNSEAMAYQDLTLRGQNHYTIGRLYRGWGGTHIQDHTSGSYWHRHGGGIFGIEYNEDKVGITFSYKVVPYNFAGQGVDVSSVDASTHTIQGSFFRPQIQGTLHTYPHSVENGNSSIDMRSKEWIDLIAGGCDIDFEWSDAARLSGWGTQGYGAGDYGRFTVDITSPEYRVQVLSNDLTTVVRCTTTTTGFYNYGINANSEDFNGWNGDFLVKVTPFNEFGDAPRTATKRMRAF